MPEGLEWLLDLKASVDKAVKFADALDKADKSLKDTEKSTKSTEKAVDALDAEFNALNKTLQHLERPHKITELKRRIEELRNPIKETTGLWDRFKKVAEFEFIRRGVDAAIDGMKELGHKIFEVGEEMVSVAAKAERTEMSFKLLMGVEGGEETLHWIDHIAKFTEFTDDQLKGMAVDLAKVGFQGEGLRRAVSAATDMAAFSGSGDEGAQSAIGALARIRRTGNVDNRVLGGLGLGEKAFFGELSERTGMGIDAIKEKIQKGTLDTEEAIETLYSMISKKTGKDLGGAGVSMSNTLQARFKHLKDIPEQFYQKLAGAEGFSKLSDFTGRIVSLLDPDSDFGKKISGSLTSVFDTVTGKLADIPIEDLMNRGLAILEQVPSAVSAVTDTVKELAEAFAPVVSAFEAAGKFAGLFSDNTKYGKNAEAMRYDPAGLLLQQKLKDKLLISKASAAAGVPYNDPDKVFGPQETGADRLARQYAEMGKLAAGGMKKGLEKATPGAAGASELLAGRAEDAAKDRLKIQSPSKVFEDIGRQTGAGFNRGVEASMSGTDDVMRGAFAVPSRIPPVTSRGGGEPPVIQVTVETHIAAVAGDNAQHTADLVSASVKEILPGALQSAIEQLAIQAGGSI